MNKKLFLAMSRRRVSCPLTVQQLWDAVKIIRYKRQVPDIERISRYMNRTHNVSDDEVGRQINYCVRDGLLKVIKKIGSKGSKIGIEQEGYKLPDDKLEKDGHDWYCFECHSGGDVICCTSCHRVYHLSCISKDDLPEDDVKNKFTCNVCKRCANRDLTPNIKKSQLNRLLKYTATKMKDRLPVALTDRQPPSNTSYLSERFAIQGQVKSPSIDVPSNFKWVLNDKEDWRVDYLIYRPIDLHIMESKADCGRYDHLEEFRADIQTIVHNVVIYHGVHSNMADMARLMLRDCSTDLQEILECWLCYKHSNDKSLRNWFIKPCKPPHGLVYARQKGYPYWPAKVIKENGDTFDVRFFGGVHEKAVVQKQYIRPISVNIHTLQVKRTSSWNRACEELKRYQKQLDKLREETDNFTKPFVDSSSDESDQEMSSSKRMRDDCKKNASLSEDHRYDRDDDKNENDDDDDDDEYHPQRRHRHSQGSEPSLRKKKNEPVSSPKIGTMHALQSFRISSDAESETSAAASDKYVKDAKTKSRGRGRPRKSTLVSSDLSSPATAVKDEVVDPNLAVTAPVPEKTKKQKGRGRPPKSSTPTSAVCSASAPSSLLPFSSSFVPSSQSARDTNDVAATTVNAATKKVRSLSSASSATESNPYDSTRTSSTDSKTSKMSSEGSSAVTAANVGALETNDALPVASIVATTATANVPAVAATAAASGVASDERGNELEDNNISSTSGRLHSLPKGNEEEIVSSSSSQNPTKRSVKTQTKPSDNKPSKEWIEKMEEEFEQEKERIVAKLNKEHEREIALLRQAHTTILSETKRKQWCVNCESEAIYHCCWNTSYCSLDCQLAHWAADHKRHCRRKR